MMPARFYADEERAKQQARYLKKANVEEITVATWLGGFRKLFPDERVDLTKHKERKAVAAFVAKYGKRRMASITAIEAQAWALKCSRTEVKPLKVAWAYAVRMQVVPLNIWLLVVLPKRAKRDTRPPTAVELDMILLRAREQYRTELANMIEVAAYSGARQAGLIGLRRRDVHLPTARMTVTEKGNKTRTVVLAGPALEAMRRQCHVLEPIYGTANPYVWSHGWLKTGRGFERKRMDAKKLRTEWLKVRGDFPFGWHTLRHYCSTWMAEQGVDDVDIAIQLGHTDEMGRPYPELVNRVYSHPSRDDALGRIEALTRSLESHHPQGRSQ